MTPDNATAATAIEPKTVDANKSTRSNTRRHIFRIARQIAGAEFGTGPLAELRRHDARVVSATPAFHRLTANMDDVSWPGDMPRRWATVIQAMAIGTRPGEHSSEKFGGDALAEAGYAENRFARLLAASGETFRKQIILLARYMNSKQTRFSWDDLGELVLVEGLDASWAERRADELRFKIARQYYRALAKNKPAA